MHACMARAKAGMQLECDARLLVCPGSQYPGTGRKPAGVALAFSIFGRARDVAGRASCVHAAKVYSVSCSLSLSPSPPYVYLLILIPPEAI
jgi:hypothetical protein